MKPDEEHVRWAVARYLREQEPNSLIAIKEGDNPPDYVVSVDDDTFNLEVTSIVAGVRVGDREHSEVGLVVELTRTAKTLCAQLQSEPWLSGAYVIHLEPVPNLKGELPALADACATYMKETAHYEEAPDQPLPFHWSIMKYSNSHPFVSYTLCAAEPSWEGEIQEELALLVGEAVMRKQLRAATKGGAWVLALLDRYHVAALDHWLRAVESSGGHSFRSILLVGPQGECRLLSGSVADEDLPSNQGAPPAGWRRR